MNERIELHSLNRSRLGGLGLALLLLGMSAPLSAYASRSAQAPAAPFNTTSGQTLSTASLTGRPTLLWLMSTWCGSCAAGLQTLAQHAKGLQKAGLRVVVLRNYHNDGYPGMRIAAFTRKVLPHFKPPKNWILGQASRQLGQGYNAKHYPDVYFLIDAKGRIRAVDSAPSATFPRILAFAKNPANR